VYRNLAFCLLLIISLGSRAQNPTPGSNPDPSKAPAAAITLEQAIQLAKANAPQFRQALTESGLAREDKVQARAALLPGVSYTTGAI
jgi:outer membrane protein TolC